MVSAVFSSIGYFVEDFLGDDQTATPIRQLIRQTNGDY